MSLIGKWSWWKDAATATTNITASYSDKMIDYVDRKVVEEIIKQVSTRYVKENYATLTKSIKPSQLKDEVVEQIAAKTLKKLFGGSDE